LAAANAHLALLIRMDWQASHDPPTSAASDRG
jgi:hypothetical protein